MELVKARTRQYPLKKGIYVKAADEIDITDNQKNQANKKVQKIVWEKSKIGIIYSSIFSCFIYLQSILQEVYYYNNTNQNYIYSIISIIVCIIISSILSQQHYIQIINFPLRSCYYGWNRIYAIQYSILQCICLILLCIIYTLPSSLKINLKNNLYKYPIQYLLKQDKRLGQYKQRCIVLDTSNNIIQKKNFLQDSLYLISSQPIQINLYKTFLIFTILCYKLLIVSIWCKQKDILSLPIINKIKKNNNNIIKRIYQYIKLINEYIQYIITPYFTLTIIILIISIWCSYMFSIKLQIPWCLSRQYYNIRLEETIYSITISNINKSLSSIQYNIWYILLYRWIAWITLPEWKSINMETNSSIEYIQCNTIDKQIYAMTLEDLNNTLYPQITYNLLLYILIIILQIHILNTTVRSIQIYIINKIYFKTDDAIVIQQDSSSLPIYIMLSLKSISNTFIEENKNSIVLDKQIVEENTANTVQYERQQKQIQLLCKIFLETTVYRMQEQCIYGITDTGASATTTATKSTINTTNINKTIETRKEENTQLSILQNFPYIFLNAKKIRKNIVNTKDMEILEEKWDQICSVLSIQQSWHIILSYKRIQCDKVTNVRHQTIYTLLQLQEALQAFVSRYQLGAYIYV